MKTFNKRTISPSFLMSFNYNPSIVIVAFIFLFAITGFVSVNESPSNDFFIQGVVFEVETTDHEQSPPKTEVMEVKVQGKNLKMEILPDADKNGKGEMIFRGDKGTNGEVVIVDDDKKEYYIMDDAFVKSLLGSIDESKSMMDDAMKNLTKEQREMIEKAQKKSGNKMPPGMGMMKLPSKPELKKTGERGTKAGYPCVKYEVYLDGNKIREIWTTDWDNIDGGGVARDAFAGMNNFFKKIKNQFGSMFGGSSPYDDMNFENGFPVITRSFNDGSLEDESWLKKTRREHLDPDAFEPPSGYTRRSMSPR